MKVTVNEVNYIDWQFVTHEERESILENDEAITQIEEIEVRNGEAWCDGCIESVEAWIKFVL